MAGTGHPANKVGGDPVVPAILLSEAPRAPKREHRASCLRHGPVMTADREP